MPQWQWQNFWPAARTLQHSTHLAITAGLFVILGHMFPVWLHFKGGKGVATAFGVFLALCPLAALSAFVLWLAVVAVTRYVSLASILAAVVLPFLTLWLSPGRYGYASGAAVFVCCWIVIVKHRQNIVRLIQGHGARLWRSRENRGVSRIAIVGSGSWGTALALSLARRGDHSIALWSHSARVGTYLPGFPIPAQVNPVTDLAAAVAGADIVISAVPSQHVRAIYHRWRPS